VPSLDTFLGVNTKYYIIRSLSATDHFKENGILATVKSRNPTEQQNAHIGIFIFLEYVTIPSVTNNIRLRGEV
jgi:hypothetical protein